MSETSGILDLPIAGSRSSNTTTPNVNNILGVNVCVVKAGIAVADIVSAIQQREHRKVSFLNAHGANIAFKDPDYLNVLKQFTVLSDGVGLDLGAQVLYGSAFPENLNGTDFIPHLFNEIDQSLNVALIGAQPGAAEAAAARFAHNHPQHRFRVISDGYFGLVREPKVLKDVEKQRPDILLVALGNPLQENWIAHKCDQRHATVAIGVGALFDFTSGRVSRAPDWIINIRMEWLLPAGAGTPPFVEALCVGQPAVLVARVDAETGTGGQMKSHAVDQNKTAIISPSYNRDFQRCQLLCDSIDRFVSEPVDHYILVDDHDYRLFASLAGSKRHIINENDILPTWFKSVRPRSKRKHPQDLVLNPHLAACVAGMYSSCDGSRLPVIFPMMDCCIAIPTCCLSNPFPPAPCGGTARCACIARIAVYMTHCLHLAGSTKPGRGMLPG